MHDNKMKKKERKRERGREKPLQPLSPSLSTTTLGLSLALCPVNSCCQTNKSPIFVCAVSILGVFFLLLHMILGMHGRVRFAWFHFVYGAVV